MEDKKVMEIPIENIVPNSSIINSLCKGDVTLLTMPSL